MSHLPGSSRLVVLTATAALLACPHPASTQQAVEPPVTVPMMPSVPISNSPLPPPPPVRPAPSPPPVSIPPPAPPPPPPANPGVNILSPADQLATALSDRDLNKATALLSADASLAKTSSSDGTPPLVSALKNFYGYDNTSKQLLQMLLDDGANINAADRSGNTPLQTLLMRGNGGGSTDTLLLLLNKGADIKAKNAEGKNALLLAAGSGDIGSVTLLLSRGADVNASAASGDTPLHLAITGQNPDMIDALLNAGANVNVRNARGEMPIHLAMRLTALQPAYTVASRFMPSFGPEARPDKRRGNPLLVPQLLDRGAQINARDQSGLTPLLFALLNCDKINYAVLMQRHAAMDTLTTIFNAAATDDSVTLARLLKTLPDIKDLRAPNGATALHVAALWNAPDAVRLLLHSGLETSTRDAAQETPLHYACWLPQNTPMLGILLDAGANINAEDVFGETPLHMAVHTHSPELLRLLLAHKALPDLPNSNGETPLSLAVNQGAVDMATALVADGANVNGHSRYGSSLLINAIQNRSAPMVALLVANGADVNYVSAERGGDSPLAVAVQNDNKDIVQLLLDKGADVNYKSRWGQSILSLARNYNNSGVADLLKQHGAK